MEGVKPSIFYLVFNMAPLKLRVCILILVFAIGTSSVIILYLIADKVNHHANNFLRLIPPHAISKKETWNVPSNSFRITGITDDNIYLYHILFTDNMLKYNIAKKDTTFIKWHLKGNEKMKFNSERVFIDSTNFYIMDGGTSTIFKGDVFNWEAQKIRFNQLKFSEAKPLPDSTFLFRNFDRRTGFQIGKTFRMDSLKFTSKLLEMQNNEPLSTDGMFHYDTTLSRIIYLYYYRNQFICVDKDLNLLYRGKTIDTTSIAKIKTRKRTVNGEISMASPPLTINKMSCVGGGYLFVNSALLANNENKKLFDSNNVIDVYNLVNGKYKLSFYLSSHSGEKMKEFRVHNKMLIVLYDHYLIRYKLNQAYFHD
ncbi:hypothetical protein [Pedobacter frigoris]|uniref:Uncharacterized protein n=1 Tax=Pedobacter frigoris TaxID=2571272 RepID=A0A4U1CQ95_9SPHI|nr:hypothetical protein [Pedobacter frigoris]TKC08985.1 hypothetical protein FA047_02500 [Pedobacter frigoris]